MMPRGKKRCGPRPADLRSQSVRFAQSLSCMSLRSLCHLMRHLSRLTNRLRNRLRPRNESIFSSCETQKSCKRRKAKCDHRRSHAIKRFLEFDSLFNHQF
jgi:hypothetical protein